MPGFTGVITIPMLGRGHASDTSQVIFERSRTPFDTGDYSSGSYTCYFKIDCNNINTVDYDVDLLDDDDNVVATITIPASTGSSGNYKTLWSSSFTPVTGYEEYRIAIDATAIAGQVYVVGAEMVIEVSGATDAAFYIPLGLYDDAAPTASDVSGYLWNTQTGSYLNDNHEVMGAWEYVDGQYAGSSVAYYFEVVGRYSDTSPNYGNVGLLDVDDSYTLVSSSEMEVEGGSVIGVHRAALTVGQLTDGHLYEWNAHSNGFLKNMSVYRAGIWVKVTDITAARTWHQLMGGKIIGASGSFDVEDHRFKFESSKNDYSAAVFASVSKYTLGSTGCDCELIHFGTSDGPGAGSPTSVETHNLSSGKGYQEESVSLTDTYRYGGAANRTQNAGRIYAEWLVLDFEVFGNISVADDLNNWADSVTVQLDTLFVSVSDDLNSWQDSVLNSYGHKQVQVGDNLNNWDDSAIVQSSHLEVRISDQMGLMDDHVALVWPKELPEFTDQIGPMQDVTDEGLSFDDFVQLSVWLETSVADDMDNWADAVSLDLYAQQEALVADDLNNWADSVNVSLDIQLSVNVSDDLNNWADSIEGGIILGVTHSNDILILMDLDHPDGSSYHSTETVIHPSRMYKGDVISFGRLERSISAPVGFTRVSDITIRMADTEGTFRQLFAHKTSKKSRITLRLVPRGESVSAALVIYRGTVVNATFPPGECHMLVSDTLFDAMADEIPPLISKENFPNMPANASEGFAPIIYGSVSSADKTGNGAIECPYVDTVNKYFLIARHRISAVTKVYVRTSSDDWTTVRPSRSPDWAGAPTSVRAEFTELTSGWDVVEEEKIISGVEYTISYLHYSGAADDTQIRVDVDGLVDILGVLVDNPALAIKEHIEKFVEGVEAGDTDLMDYSGINAAAAKLAAENYTISGVVDSMMSHGEVLTRINKSFYIDMFQNIGGRITLRFTREITPREQRQNFDDLLYILLDSMQQSLADPVANRIEYRYGRIPSENEWFYEATYNNVVDQEILEGEILEENWEMPFLGDLYIADDVILLVASYLDLNAWRIKFNTVGPLVIDKLELADDISVTHYEGLSVSGTGYNEEPFKVLGLVLDMDTLQMEVRAIHRLAIPDAGGMFQGDWAVNARVGPYKYGGSGQFFGVFRNPYDTTQMKIVYTQDWGQNWTDDLTFIPLSDIITSFDAQFDPAGYLHVSIQEQDTGRVSYHRYNMSTLSWDMEDEEIVASAALYGYNDWHIYGRAGTCGSRTSICLSDDNKLWVIWQDSHLSYDDGVSHELVSGPGWLRFKKIKISYRNRDSGSWSTPEVIGSSSGTDRCINSSQFLGRVVPGWSGRVHVFYKQAPGDFSAAKDDFCVNTYGASGHIFGVSTGVLYPAPCPVGGWERWTDVDDGVNKIGVTWKEGWGALRYFVFWERNNLGVHTDGGDIDLVAQSEYVGTAQKWESTGVGVGDSISELGNAAPQADLFYMDEELYWTALLQFRKYGVVGGNAIQEEYSTSYIKATPSANDGFVSAPVPWSTLIFRQGIGTYICGFTTLNTGRSVEAYSVAFVLYPVSALPPTEEDMGDWYDKYVD